MTTDTQTQWGLGYVLADGSVSVLRENIPDWTARDTARKIREAELKSREDGLPKDEWAAIPLVLKREVTWTPWQPAEEA